MTNHGKLVINFETGGTDHLFCRRLLQGHLEIVSACEAKAGVLAALDDIDGLPLQSRGQACSPPRAEDLGSLWSRILICHTALESGVSWSWYFSVE